MSAPSALRDAATALDALDPSRAARVVTGALCAAGLCLPDAIVASVALVARPVLRLALTLLADALEGDDLSHVVVPPLRRAAYLDLAAIAAERPARDTDPAPAPTTTTSESEP